MASKEDRHPTNTAVIGSLGSGFPWRVRSRGRAGPVTAAANVRERRPMPGCICCAAATGRSTPAGQSISTAGLPATSVASPVATRPAVCPSSLQWQSQWTTEPLPAAKRHASSACRGQPSPRYSPPRHGCDPALGPHRDPVLNARRPRSWHCDRRPISGLASPSSPMPIAQAAEAREQSSRAESRPGDARFMVTIRRGRGSSSAASAGLSGSRTKLSSSPRPLSADLPRGEASQPWALAAR